MDYLMLNIAIGLLLAAGLYLQRVRNLPAAPHLKVSIALARVACADQRDYLCARVVLHGSSTDQLWIRTMSVRIGPVAQNGMAVRQPIALRRYTLETHGPGSSALPMLTAEHSEEDLALTLQPGDTALFAHPMTPAYGQALTVQVLIQGVGLAGGSAARWTSASVFLPDSTRKLPGTALPIPGFASPRPAA